MNKLNEELQQKAQQYIRESFVHELELILQPVCTARVDEESIVHVEYPVTAREPYLRPEILLEPGPLAAWTPHDTQPIKPYAAEEFPDHFETPGCKVEVIKAERTLWEKATILHAEAHRPETSPTPSRHSRHYYDVALMADAPVKKKAFADLELLSKVAEFKDKFYHSGWANYDQARPGSFKLLPPDRILKVLENDYRQMRVMIFDKPPSFQAIVEKLGDLETEINSL